MGGMGGEWEEWEEWARHKELAGALPFFPFFLEKALGIGLGGV